MVGIILFILVSIMVYGVYIFIKTLYEMLHTEISNDAIKEDDFEWWEY